MSFRVSELQLLASYAGWSKYGRKTDLLQRALYQVDRNTTNASRLHQKIKELYR